MSGWASRRWPLAAAVVLTLVLTGCGDPAPEVASTTTAAGRPVTEAEAGRLADVLVRNHDLGGAAVSAEVPYGPGASFSLVGEIDWAAHVGRLEVTPTVSGEAGTSFGVAFDQRLVFEEVPGLAEELAAQGRPAASWVVRPLDPTTSPLDVVLRLIDASSSTQRDNPVLLQSRGTRWVGRATVDGLDCDVFDLGRTRYAVDRADGLLRRVEAELDATSSTVTVGLRDHGPRTVAVPTEDEVIPLEAVRDLYARLRREG